MFRFTIKVLAAFFIIISALWLLPFRKPGNCYVDAYHHHWPSRHSQFLIIGASNLPFALDSETLRSYKIDFQSWGFHGAVGARYHMNASDSLKKAGWADQVILSPPPSWIWEPESDHLLSDVLSSQPNLTNSECIAHFGLISLLQAKAAIFDYFIFKWVESKPWAPAPTSFRWDSRIIDHNGVIKRGLRPDSSSEGECPKIKGKLDANFWASYRDKVDGLLVPAMHPCPEMDAEQISFAYSSLARVLGCPLIIPTEDCFYPSKFFSDTHLHLNDAGAFKYSSALAESLRKKNTTKAD